MSIDRFQAARNAALAGFLHGAHLTRGSRILYPLRDVSGPRAADALEAVRAAAVAADLELPAPPASPSSRDEAAFLALAHRVSEPAAEGAGDGDVPEDIAVPGWDRARHGRVPQLVRARRALRGLGRVFVHGSYADLTFTPYSDLDTLLVIPRDVVTSPAALLACRKRVIASLRALRAFDPLQHHGHFVLAETDLPAYPDAVFPAVVWRTCVALDEAGARVPLASRRCEDESGRRFRLLARRLLDTDLTRGRTNAFRLKSDLSVFMLLPALWLQARGVAVSKAASFEQAYPALSERGRAAFAQAARIRGIWTYREPRLNRWLRRLWFNPLLPAYVDAARAAAPPQAVLALTGDAFLADVRAAVEEMLGKEDRGVDRTGARDAVA